MDICFITETEPGRQTKTKRQPDREIQRHTEKNSDRETETETVNNERDNKNKNLPYGTSRNEHQPQCPSIHT